MKVRKKCSSFIAAALSPSFHGFFCLPFLSLFMMFYFLQSRDISQSVYIRGSPKVEIQSISFTTLVHCTSIFYLGVCRITDFHNSKWRIQDDDRKTKKHDNIGKNIFTQGFLGSLIMNPLPDFHNLKWRIQDGDRKDKKSTMTLVTRSTQGFLRSLIVSDAIETKNISSRFKKF